MRTVNIRPLLLPALLLAASCGRDPVPPPGAGGAPGGGAPAPASAALRDFRWDPDDLLPLPGEMVAQPGTGDTWLEGVVEDPDGKPLPGATVTVSAVPGSDIPTVPMEHARTTTGPDGRFRVGPGPTPWSGVGVLNAWAPGLARTSLVSQVLAGPGEPWAEPGHECVLRLRPGIPMKGAVRGVDGGPPDGPVSLWILGTTAFSEVTVTDADGGFSFLAPEGLVTLNAVEGFHPYVRTVAEAKPGAENFVKIPVLRGRDIPVRILDAETREPVKGAVIRTYYGRTTIERVPEDGRFLLKKYWFSAFQARAPGYAARFNFIPADAGTPENPEMVVHLLRGFVARGRITDLDGRPLSGLRAHCFAMDSGGAWLDIVGGVSKEDGSYTFVGLPVPEAGTEVRVIGIAPGFGHGCSAALAGKPGGLLEGADVRVRRLVPLRGRVLDEHGEPVPVRLEIQWELAGGLGSYVPKIPDRITARVLEDGTWSALVPERSRVAIRASSDAIAEALVEAVTPAHPGGDREAVPGAPILVKVLRGGTIRGVVVDVDGRSPGRGEVRIEPSPAGDGRPSRDGWIRPDGSFEIGGLTPGLHDLSILVHPEFLQEVVLGVETGGEPVKVVLRRPGGILGKVVPPENSAPGALAEVTVRALGPSAPLPPGRTGRVPLGGAFRIGPLTPGPYSVSVTAGDLRMDLERVLVDDGGVLDLGDIVLSDPTGSAEGILRIAGRPAAGVSVEVLRVLPEARFESVRRIRSGPDGAWRAGGLAAGEHIAVVHPQDRPLVQVPFTSVPGVPSKVDLAVPSGGTLVVTVLDQEGKPVAGARVILRGKEESLPFWAAGDPGAGPHLTGPDGRLRCAGVPAGSCRVIGDLPGSGSGEAEVEILDGAGVAVEVRLVPR